MRGQIEAHVRLLVEPLEVGLARAASEISVLSAKTARTNEEQNEAIRKCDHHVLSMEHQQAELASQLDAAKLKILNCELRATEILRHSEEVEKKQDEVKCIFLQRIDHLRDGVLAELAELKRNLFGEHGARGLSSPLVEQVIVHQKSMLDAESKMGVIERHLSDLQEQLRRLGLLNYLQMHREIEAAIRDVEQSCADAIKVVHHRVDAVEEKETTYAALVEKYTQVTAATQQGEKELVQIIEAMKARLQKLVTKDDLLKLLEAHEQSAAQSDSILCRSLDDIRGQIEDVRRKFEAAMSAIEANTNSIQQIEIENGERMDQFGSELSDIKSKGAFMTNQLSQVILRLDVLEGHIQGTIANRNGYDEQLAKLHRDVTCLLGLPDELTETRVGLITEIKLLKEKQTMAHEEVARLSSTDSAARHAVDWVSRNAPALERFQPVTDQLRSQADCASRRQDRLQSDIEQLRLDLAVADEANEERRRAILALVDDRCPSSLLADYSLLSTEVQRLAIQAKEATDDLFAQVRSLDGRKSHDDAVAFERISSVVAALEAEIRRALFNVDENLQGVVANSRQQGALLTSLEQAVEDLRHNPGVTSVDLGLLPDRKPDSELLQKVTILESRYASLNANFSHFETYVNDHKHDSPSNAEHAALVGRSAAFLPFAP